MSIVPIASPHRPSDLDESAPLLVETPLHPDSDDVEAVWGTGGARAQEAFVEEVRKQEREWERMRLSVMAKRAAKLAETL